MKRLADTLADLADGDRYLYSVHDLAAVIPDQSDSAFKALLGRAGKNGIIQRVCRGLYLYPRANYPSDLVLYHAAARLRANEFSYLSLESVLSDAGVISQIPLNWITLMSTGRNYIFDCGAFGHIEFIHTKRTPENTAPQLHYDPRCRLWRASVAQALQDMKQTRRDTDLVDWEVASELL